MSTKIEIVNENLAIVSVDVDSNEVDKAFDYAIIEAFKKANDGKEPTDAEKAEYIEKNGTDSLLDEVINKIVADAHYNAITSNRLQPANYPQLEIKNNLEKGKGFSFVLKFDIVPKLHLGKYKGVCVKRESCEVTQSELDSAIKNDIQAKKQIITKNSASQIGDIVIIDFEGFTDGVAFDGGKAEKYSLTLGSNTFIPGFEDQLVGYYAGDNVDVNVTFPERYAEHLAGKDAVFKVKIHVVQEEKLPSLSDEIVKDITNGKCQSVDDYISYKRNELFDEKSKEANDKLEDSLFRAIIDDSYANLPASMIEGELENSVKRLEETAKGYNLSLDILLTFYGLSSIDEYKEKERANVKNRILLSLITEVIAEREGLFATPDEVEGYYVNTANETKDDTRPIDEKIKELKEKYSQGAIAGYITSTKVLFFIKENATIEQM